MKFTAILTSLLALVVVPVLASVKATVTYDARYDARTASLDTVACSDGANGLEKRGFTTLGSLPSFPNIGAAYAVAGWNSTACGTCWQLTYTNAKGASKSINVTAVDHAGADSFNIAQEAMNTLTNNQSIALGRVSVTSVQVPSSGCGL
ncbi:Cerato-platanin [Amanita rubescens]|nr:Cerato-platanin [Amanita rubescens]